MLNAVAVSYTLRTPFLTLKNHRCFMMDATAILAILGVIGSVIVFAFLGVRITSLMKTCKSED